MLRAQALEQHPPQLLMREPARLAQLFLAGPLVLPLPERVLVERQPVSVPAQTSLVAVRFPLMDLKRL